MVAFAHLTGVAQWAVWRFANMVPLPRIAYLFSRDGRLGTVRRLFRVGGPGLTPLVELGRGADGRKKTCLRNSRESPQDVRPISMLRPCNERPDR